MSPLPTNVEFSAKDSLLRARFRGPFVGLDTTSSITDMDFLALRLADNTDIEDNGTIKKRNGYTSLLGADWTGEIIHQGLEFKYGTNIALTVAGHAAGASSGKFGKVTAAFAGISDIKTGLANTRPSIFSMDNRLFYFNGTDDFLYDGTNTRQIGITAPTNAPTLNTTINGSLVPGAIYIYSYTYYNSVTGAESSPSPLFISPAVSADPLDGFRLNVTSGDATTADTIRLYRTVASGVVPSLDTTAAIGATTIDSTKGDAGLGKAMELDNSRHTLFGNFKYGWGSENRVFLTGNSTKPSRAIVSAIYSEGPHPESFPAKNFIDCESSRGAFDYNLGGGMAGDTVIIQKKNSVGRIEKIGADSTDPTLQADPVVFVYREISRAVTGVSHFSACTVFGEYIWLGRDNVYATDGTNVRAIGDKIRATILSYNFLTDDKFSAFNDITNKRIYISIKSSQAQTECDYVLVGKYNNYPDFAWSIYRPGINATTHPGILSGCFFEALDFDNTRRVLFGNNQFNGKLYYLNTGTNDDGFPIYFRIRFAPVSFGFDEEEKLFIQDIVQCLGNGLNYNLTARSFYNFGDVDQESQFLNLNTSISLWGSLIWGAGLWGSGTSPIIRNNNIHTKAFFKQLQLENFNADQPITIFNYQTMARSIHYRGASV